MRPEHFHYDYAEHWIQGCISSGEAFLYDPDRFHIELHNISMKTGFPREVRFVG
jgi:ABC-type microcin C transport system permease subunit YejE